MSILTVVNNQKFLHSSDGTINPLINIQVVQNPIATDIIKTNVLVRLLFAFNGKLYPILETKVFDSNLAPYSILTIEVENDIVANQIKSLFGSKVFK